jgi:hypothetical protein
MGIGALLVKKDGIVEEHDPGVDRATGSADGGGARVPFHEHEAGTSLR